MNNIWKKIDFNPIYEVNSEGVVRNTSLGKINKPFIRNGYYSVKLWNKGVSRNFLVHRLISIYFIENKDNKPYINHKDANKLNNSITNLEWCTPKENFNHAKGLGLIKETRGEDVGGCKLTESNVLDIVKRINSGESFGQISKDYNITRSAITRISMGKNWKHLDINIDTNTKSSKSISKKIVDQYGNIYYSVTEAALKIKTSIGNVSMVLNGIREHTKGYKFYLYKEEK